MLTHALAIGAWAGFCEWEIRQNANLIAANGSADTLKNAFHAGRTKIRAAVAVTLALAASLPLWGSWAMLASFVTLIAFFVGYFVRTFNPQLNVRRALSYVERFYVSLELNAAKWPDRWIGDRARAKYPDSLIAQRIYAAHELKFILNCLLFAGILVECCAILFFIMK